MQLGLGDLLRPAGRPDRLADAADRAALVPVDEVPPGGDDQRRIVAQVCHVGEDHPARVLAERRPQGLQSGLGDRHHHRFLPGQAVPDERHNGVQEPAAAFIQQALVPVGWLRGPGTASGRIGDWRRGGVMEGVAPGPGRLDRAERMNVRVSGDGRRWAGPAAARGVSRHPAAVVAAVRGVEPPGGVGGTDNPEMVSWVGGGERPGVGHHQFDERQLWSDQSVFGRGMVQHLVEHTLIARTGEDPIAAGNDVSAAESLHVDAGV